MYLIYKEEVVGSNLPQDPFFLKIRKKYIIQARLGDAALVIFNLNDLHLSRFDKKSEWELAMMPRECIRQV